MLTLSQRRTMAKHGQAKVAAEQRAWQEEQKAADELANKERMAAKQVAKQAEADREKITRDKLEGAVLVRSATYGWRKVRRVNAKTVSVDSGYSWADLIPLEKILDYRK